MEFRRHAALLAGAALALGGCRATGTAFGPTPEAAGANAESFFGAVAARFTNVQRDAKYDAARQKLGRYALSPSGAYGDTAIWSGGSGNLRTLTVGGRLVGNRYVFQTNPAAPAPMRPGDSWHLIRLARLRDGEYEWSTAVDMNMGTATPDELLAVWRSLLATAVRSAGPGAGLRADYRAAVPRATAALGQLATLDSLASRRLADGSAVVELRFSLHPERLQGRYPHLARFVAKYLRPARYGYTFADRGGAAWMVATMRDGGFLVRLRALPDGRMAPLEGAVRPMPDTLVLRGEAHAKFSIFNVGASDIVGTMAVVGSARERGWHFRFQEEPDWHFPLAVNHLIKSALRRPFAGDGTQLRLVFQRRSDGQTVIARRLTVPVQEAAIVRWLGKLGFGAMSDYSGQAEEDENRFTVEVFTALQEDFAALVGRGGARAATGAGAAP